MQRQSHSAAQRCLCYVGTKNLTHVREFLLLGLSDDPELQPVLFGLFLSMYLVTVLGNLLIILAVGSDSHLHTPMYFFLSILALADIGFTSTTVPKMILDNKTHSRVISYAGCLTQMSICVVFACMDNIILTAMAYDRFVAICHPLHYPVIMNPRLCGLLVLASFIISFLDSQLHTLMAVQLMFFIDVELPTFFCGPSQLFNIACFKIPNSTLLMCPTYMEHQNLTGVSEFLLLGLSEDPELQPLLFGLLLSMYLVTILRNLLIILAVGTVPTSTTPCTFSSPACPWLTLVSAPPLSPRRCLSYMGTKNLTAISEFLLLGLSDDPELQPLLLGLFLSMYLATVLGNLLIILDVGSDPHLHTPMYFFLSILSLADIGFTSTTVPKMILDNQSHSRVISYAGCLTRMSIFIVFGCMDSILLTAMACDRFVAICHPLHYPVIMNPRLCGLLVLASFFISLLDSHLHSLMVVQLTFFIDVELPNFFCGPSQLFNIACFKIPTSAILMYFTGAIFGGVPVSGILLSYYKIVSSFLRDPQQFSQSIQSIPSAGGKYKDFSTCGSPLSIVCLLCGPDVGLSWISVVTFSQEGCLCYAEPQNLTGVVEFLLLGLTEDPELQPFLFGLFLSMYLVTVLGNLLIILAIVSDPHLHTPMYFFLSILSLADLGFTSTTVPEMIFDIQTHRRIVSYVGCLFQLSFLKLFGGLDSVVLTVIVYDWSVAVCHPLHHVTIMNPASVACWSCCLFRSAFWTPSCTA
ncbi:Olfactory Receptor 7E24 [Manis pentadactyla]|nr:Olfactory Receptor 7E24 [Manis pentadactyla]